MDQLLTVKEVAGILNIKIGTLYSHLSRGTPLPPFIRIGSQTRWREEVIKKWIEAREKERRRKHFEE